MDAAAWEPDTSDDEQEFRAVVVLDGRRYTVTRPPRRQLRRTETRDLPATRLPPIVDHVPRTLSAADVEFDDRSYVTVGNKRARVAASSKAILGLQEVSAGDARMQAECAVYLQDFDAEDKLRAMPCSHAFHQDCIFRWLRINRVCPLCRHELPTQQQEDEVACKKLRMPATEEA
uniref:RING-type domain-containing protein n=1 Tax=Arundo donax TaxID=35708 RepID=A0A0A8ZMX7_ARUDO